MPDPKKQSDSSDDLGYFSSDCDLLEIREEDTQPGKVSDRYRKVLEEKYGRKAQPPNAPEEEP